MQRIQKTLRNIYDRPFCENMSWPLTVLRKSPNTSQSAKYTSKMKSRCLHGKAKCYMYESVARIELVAGLC